MEIRHGHNAKPIPWYLLDIPFYSVIIIIGALVVANVALSYTSEPHTNSLLFLLLLLIKSIILFLSSPLSKIKKLFDFKNHIKKLIEKKKCFYVYNYSLKYIFAFKSIWEGLIIWQSLESSLLMLTLIKCVNLCL